MDLPATTLDSAIVSTQSAPSTIPEDQINLDTTALLQQLQSSGMILTATTENDVVSSLILDDVTLLNFDPSKDNFQIIPLLDSGVQLQNGSDYNQDTPKSTKKQECQICQKLYSTKDGLRRHIKKIHCKTKFSCEKCSLRFDTEEELGEHLEEHNSLIPTDFVNDQGQTLYINVEK